MILPDFQFYSRMEYFQDLIKRCKKLGPNDAITLMSMQYDTRVPIIGQLSDALINAARQGADVRLIVDAMSFMLANNAVPGPFLYGRKPTVRSVTPYGRTFAKLEELRQAGGEYRIIHQPPAGFNNPYGGRSHIKLAVVNDRIYIPSCNFDNDDHLDVVTSWHDPETARWLRDFTARVIDAGSVRNALNDHDETHIINQRMRLFVDSGVKRQSRIYDQALALIDNAQERLLITCQYFPGGATARHLLSAAERGVTPQIFYSHPRSHGLQVVGQTLYNSRERLRMPASFFSRQMKNHKLKLHAKVLISEQTAMTGSHNYVTMGVNFGTAEIALQVDDPAFAQALGKKITDQIQAADATAPA